MIVKPVEIDIDDNWKYGEVAFLVDRDDFLVDLIKARKKLKIDKLIPFGGKIQWSERKELVLRKLLVKYRKPLNYRPIIMDAIVYGKVAKSKIVDDVYCTIIYPHDVISDLQNNIAQPQLVIAFSPETKKEEIEKVFVEQAQKAIEEYREVVLKSKRKPPDTISNIKRDRRWYWLKKDRKSYAEINKIAFSEGERLTRQAVVEAVKQYKKRLAVKL